MSSRQLVYDILNFTHGQNQRIPRQLWFLPWVRKHCPQRLEQIQRDYPDDIVTAPGCYHQKPLTNGDPYAVGAYVDEWGCVFENLQEGVIGEVKEPLIAQWSDLDKLRFPKETLTINVQEVNAFCAQTDKFVMAGCCPRPFERLQFLRSSVELYMDLAEGVGEIIDLLHEVHQFYLKELELWAQTDVDGLIYMDDWGSQRALLISPHMWRQLFKPLYREYIDLAHQHNKKIFMHSDGYILDVIPDLIELGLDALNSQIFCMSVDKMEPFKGQLTFWGEIDRQHLLPHGTTQDIADAVTQVYQTLYQNGGVIAQCEFGASANPDNVAQVFKSWDCI